MKKPKNYYIRYKRAELENYVNHPESCVKKSLRIEKLVFGPNVINNFKESVLRILSRKIGKYDRSLEGIVLDFRNTRILNTQTGIRYDSPYSVLNVETNFYTFQPRKNAIVDGTVKHINKLKMETIISVVIYRVFNVKVTFKNCGNNKDIHHNKEIKIRIKEFHFDNEIPFIEGELIEPEMSNIKKIFDDVIDSGISETSVQNELRDNEETSDDSDYYQTKPIKKEKESSTEPSNFENIANKRKSAKRKLELDSYFDDSLTLPNSKKIKQEPISKDEDLNSSQRTLEIKQEISDDTKVEAEVIKKKKKKKGNETDCSTKITNSVAQSLAEILPKKKKKKKKNIEDDFESSLQLILDSSISSIKKEKD